jgi:phage recombination protein Bet
MSEKTNTAVTKKESAMVEFVPFGASEAIKLSVGMVKTMIAVPTATGKLPTDNDCIKFIALCQARRLNPFEGDAFMIGYDTKNGPKFNLITAIQAFLKRAETSPHYNGMESGIIVERGDKIIDVEGDFFISGDKILGGWATVHKKGQEFPTKKRIRLERFKKQFGIWAEDPAGMICKCAEADALRTSFPTMLGGMYLPQEMEPSDAKTKVTAPIFTSSVDTTSKPQAEPEPEEDDMVFDEPTHEDIVKLCKRDNIKESDLIEFAQSIALCEDDCKTIDKLPAEAVATLFTQWAEFSEKIKEVCQ